jgi:hypothetical protein
VSSPADDDQPSTGEDANYERAFSELFRRFWGTAPVEEAIAAAGEPAPLPTED